MWWFLFFFFFTWEATLVVGLDLYVLEFGPLGVKGIRWWCCRVDDGDGLMRECCDERDEREKLSERLVQLREKKINNAI